MEGRGTQRNGLMVRSLGDSFQLTHEAGNEMLEVRPTPPPLTATASISPPFYCSLRISS